MNTPEPTKIAFLDTNALVNLYTFWEACRIARIGMSSVADWSAVRNALVQSISMAPNLFERDDFEPIRTGLRLFSHIQQAKPDYDFYCCHVNRSELHHVLLSADAGAELHRQRVPRSLAVKRPLIVHRRVLPHDAYLRVDQQIEDFFHTLSGEHSIDIKSVENERTGLSVPSEDIFATAEIIWSHVLMETMDAYVFAAAIECEADCLLTSDSAFRATVNNLRTNQGEWWTVSRALRASLKKPAGFAFPQGIRPNEALP